MSTRVSPQLRPAKRRSDDPPLLDCAPGRCLNACQCVMILVLLAAVGVLHGQLRTHYHRHNSTAVLYRGSREVPVALRPSFTGSSSKRCPPACSPNSSLTRYLPRATPPPRAQSQDMSPNHSSSLHDLRVLVGGGGGVLPTPPPERGGSDMSRDFSTNTGSQHSSPHLEED